jgi:branched-chain amino acid transport system permease protein
MVALGFLELIPQATIDTVLIGMVYALVAVGLALIWGVADIVNFAYGPYLVVAMLVTAIASNQYNIDPVLLVPVNAALLFGAGYVTYKSVISPVMDAEMESQIFVTFGLFLVLQYGMLVVAGPAVVSIEEFSFQGNISMFGLFISYPQLVTAVVSLLSLVLFYLFLKRTKMGKAIRATAQDEEAANVMGIDTNNVFALTWGLGTAMVGVAGTFLITFNAVQPEITPLNWTLIAFAAVALGGFGNILAAAVGGIVIAFVEQFGVRFLDPSYKQVYIFSVFLLALLIRQAREDTFEK